MIMDTLSSMSIFQRVVEMGSFTAVANETGLSQPSVSKHVSALEIRLGVRLLNRNTRHQTLTDAGREYYEHCVQILSDVAEAESVVSEGSETPKGTLRLSTPISYGQHRIAPMLWGFMEKHPDLKVELILGDSNLDLVKEGIDLAIRLGPLNDSSLVARNLGICPRYTVASTDYLKKHGHPKVITDLKDHECIVFTLLPTKNQWHFSKNKKDENVHVTGRFSTNSPHAMRDATLSGLGIAVMPMFMIQEGLDSGDLELVLKDYEPTPVPISAVYPVRRFVSQKVQCFIDYFKQNK